MTCLWCNRLIQRNYKWNRHLQDWGWGYQLKHINSPSLWTGTQNSRILLIKSIRASDKPRWGDKYTGKLPHSKRDRNRRFSFWLNEE